MDELDRATVAAVKRILRSSFKDIAFRYENLTSEEQTQITPEQFKQVVAWLGEPGPQRPKKEG